MAIDCCVILITLLFPPIGVALVYGCHADLLINICLTILGYLPGHIHAFYLMATRPDPRPVYSRPAGGYASYQSPPQQQGYYQPPPSQQKNGAYQQSTSYRQHAPPPDYKN